MAKRKKYIKKSFESSGASSDVSANIYSSMLISKAYTALTHRQQRLYTFMKLQYYAQKRHPNNNPECFYFNKSLWWNMYNLYHNPNTFAEDRDALIEKGFIKVVEDGYNTRKKTVYQYSDKWKSYGTESFNIEFSEMSKSLRSKKRKEKT
jgi:hypothetical protein